MPTSSRYELVTSSELCAISMGVILATSERASGSGSASSSDSAKGAKAPPTPIPARLASVIFAPVSTPWFSTEVSGRRSRVPWRYGLCWSRRLHENRSQVALGELPPHHVEGRAQELVGVYPHVGVG